MKLLLTLISIGLVCSQTVNGPVDNYPFLANCDKNQPFATCQEDLYLTMGPLNGGPFGNLTTNFTINETICGSWIETYENDLDPLAPVVTEYQKCIPRCSCGQGINNYNVTYNEISCLGVGKGDGCVDKFRENTDVFRTCPTYGACDGWPEVSCGFMKAVDWGANAFGLVPGSLTIDTEQCIPSDLCDNEDTLYNTPNGIWDCTGYQNGRISAWRASFRDYFQTAISFNEKDLSISSSCPRECGTFSESCCADVKVEGLGMSFVEKVCMRTEVVEGIVDVMDQQEVQYAIQDALVTMECTDDFGTLGSTSLVFKSVLATVALASTFF